MTPSKNCLDLIKKFEGYRSEAYQCSARVWTIGWGTTRYPDGKALKQGDTCTMEQAAQWLQDDVAKRSMSVLALLPKDTTQSQFDSLVSFAYNLGIGALRNSTLLRKMKADPNDPTIYTYTKENGMPVVGSCEFLKWVKAGGVVLNGLILRRAAEADLYRK